MPRRKGMPAVTRPGDRVGVRATPLGMQAGWVPSADGRAKPKGHLVRRIPIRVKSRTTDESRAYAAALQRLDEELAPLRAAHGSLPGRGVEQRFWGPAPSSGQEQAEIRRAWDARRAANG